MYACMCIIVEKQFTDKIGRVILNVNECLNFLRTDIR